MNPKTFNILTAAIFIVAFPIWIIRYFNSGAPITVFTYIGLAIMIPAIILLLIARYQLADSFSVSAKATRLVTTGLYKRFRHPIYYAGILMMLGFGFFLQQRLIFYICIFIIALQMYRIKKEEKVLEDKFGDEYRKYRESTWF
ncbi:methyltransferase family protein [Ferruginibacter albus]|uniref:methyltransferase family protein n=1 Tax=Ferruginibacter albus TaxID=2875540 RepID=UPI001CC68B9E|nr:isoprenylcysteine carboxylmethyltransferase family protein [Ferruginibacter albus]UAY53457.1 isoprenylcysteine carboxylmethyltransferase family protein [Ferruginibacter albus]